MTVQIHGGQEDIDVSPAPVRFVLAGLTAPGRRDVAERCHRIGRPLARHAEGVGQPANHLFGSVLAASRPPGVGHSITCPFGGKLDTVQKSTARVRPDRNAAPVVSENAETGGKRKNGEEKKSAGEKA